MSKATVIPLHEPEVVKAGARLRASGDEKIATTALNPMTVHSVILDSRYGKAHELELMRRFVTDLPPQLRGAVARIWCDSNASYCFSVVLHDWKHAEIIAQTVERSAMTHNKGHNGISVVALDRRDPDNVFGDRNLGEIDVSPNWVGDDLGFDLPNDEPPGAA